MDETPKKVIRSEFFCFLCSCNLGKDQVRAFRKSAVDIARLIKRAAKLQNTGPLIYISLNHNSAYYVIPRSSKDFDTCKTIGPDVLRKSQE